MRIRLVHWTTVILVAVIIGVCTGCGRSPSKLSAEDRWKQHYDDAYAELQAGRLPDAERKARLALDAADFFPKLDSRRADTLSLLGQAYHQQDKYQEAETNYQKALALCEQTSSDPGGLKASLLYKLASLYLSTNRTVDAQKTVAQGRAIYDTLLTKDEPQWVPLLALEAAVAQRNDQYERVRELLTRALAIQRKNGIEADETTGYYLKVIAIAYVTEGKFTKAVSAMEKAIPVIAATEPDSANLATAYGILGLIHTRLGHRDKAIPLYQKAIAMGRELPDLSSTDMAKMLKAYANLLEQVHRTKEAAALREEAKAILARKKDQVDRS